MRKPLLLLCIFLTASSASAQVTFSGLDLSAADRLLFSATTRWPDSGSYDTLFLADARTRAMRQLTFFPEDVQLLQNGSVLQVQNRVGVFRSAGGLGSLARMAVLPSFVSGG